MLTNTAQEINFVIDFDSSPRGWCPHQRQMRKQNPSKFNQMKQPQTRKSNMEMGEVYFWTSRPVWLVSSPDANAKAKSK
jgi:hypothetical protein